MLIISPKIKNIMACFLLAVGIVLYFSFKALPDTRFHLYFLDVGEGDSIFVKTPENHQLIIDGGPGNRMGEEISEIMPFWDRKIELLVLTHPDKDHIEGFLDLLRRYKVEIILITGVNKEDFWYEKFLEQISKQDSKIIFANEKTDFKIGELVLDVLYPENQLITKDFKEVNNSSIVLKIRCKDKQILLSGDLGEEIEKELVEKGVNIKADIFKAGHHGSKSSSSMEFLQAIKPEVVVIQVGKNSYGHPTTEALKRFEEIGAKVMRTDTDGRVEFVF